MKQFKDRLRLRFRLSSTLALFLASTLALTSNFSYAQDASGLPWAAIGGVTPYTFAGKPASPFQGQIIRITNAASAGDCSAGGGVDQSLCFWNGSNWQALGGTALGADLTALEALACTGILARTAANTYQCYTMTGQTSVLTITNPGGIAGAPGFTIANSMIDGSSHFAADSGSSDDYAACPLSISTMSTPAYVDKSIHGFTANTANTGSATLNLCGLGSRALVKLIGGISTPLSTGDILVGQPVLVFFSSSSNNFKIISQLASGGGGTGTPGGSNTQCQFNDSGVFGGDAGCTYDKTTDVLSTTGGYTAGNVATNYANIVSGGSLSGTWTYSANRNANMDLAGTTGTLTSGDLAKFNAAGLLVRGGVADRVAQFMLGAENGSALTDGDDQPSIFYNHYGQGLTINSVWCQSDAGTPSIQLQKDDGSPTNMLSSNLSCSTGTGATTTTFVSGENLVASTNRVNLVMVTAGGTAKRITVSIRYQLD